MLASQIDERYQGEPCAIVALNDGGVMVGAQIAMRLHASLGMLLADEIELPREMVAIGGVTQDGSFTYNRAYSTGEIDEFVTEYRGVIEQEKMEKLHELHRQLDNGGLLDRELLRDHHVILTSDGLSSGFSIDLAVEYLKPMSIKSIMVATPLASVPAVDRMHVVADDIFCLSVLPNYMTTDHYYDTQDVPSHDAVVKTIEQITKNWK